MILDHADLTLCRLLKSETPWRGTASALLVQLNKVGGAMCDHSGFPKYPKSLSAAIHRLADRLHMFGVKTEFNKAHGERLIHLTPIAASSAVPDHPEFVPAIVELRLEDRLREASDCLDAVFGTGYAKDHPQFLLSFMKEYRL